MKIEQVTSLGVEIGVTEEEKAELVEVIQAHTRGMTMEQRLSTAACWEWMAIELRRVCAASQPERPPWQHSTPVQLELGIG